MKQKFSTLWKGSIQPRKQRKFIYNAPLHIRHKLISVNLTKKLREKYKRRNVPIRKDDNVKILKGEFKGKTGKIERVDLKKLKVLIGGIYRTKKDGSKVKVYFEPSNLQIQELNLSDKKRTESIERKSKKKTSEKKEEKTENKSKEERKDAPKKK